MGGTVVLGYVDQSRSGLDASKTVYEEISQGLDVLTLGDREVGRPTTASPALSSLRARPGPVLVDETPDPH